MPVTSTVSAGGNRAGNVQSVSDSGDDHGNNHIEEVIHGNSDHPKALHFGRSCGRARAANAAVRCQHETRTGAYRRGAGFAGCSPARSPLVWQPRRGPFRLPLQVGAGDDPGQDAHPCPNRLPLCVRVLRGCIPGGLPAEGCGFRAAPGETLRPVYSGVVSHVLSLCVRDGVSVSGRGSSFRIISFTSFRGFGGRRHRQRRRKVWTKKPLRITSCRNPRSCGGAQEPALVRGRPGTRISAGARVALRKRPLL